MRKLIATIVCLLSAGSLAQATITLELAAGVLRNAPGTATVPAGGLLQIVATTSGTFSAPTSTSFTSGSDIVVASFGMNYNIATGVTDNTFTFSLANTGTAAGEELALRWYPTLTLASTAPGLGATYGQFRSATGENGGIAWTIPADGSANFSPGGLNFFTTDVPASTGITGTHAPMMGYATNFVTAVGVPEPSPAILLGGGLFGLVAIVGLTRKYKNSAA